MSKQILLEFSIGPVQSFVAQSRRTRDLWGSSYLLSYLSAHAALGVERAGGEIVRPLLKQDPFFNWIKKTQHGGFNPSPPPPIGSVPNQFVAAVADEGAGRIIAEAGVSALQKAWNRVCDVVWNTYVADFQQQGNGVYDIWCRQTQGYWEIAWAITAADKPGGALARRKLWRTHRWPEESGDKCMVMPDFQELSGYVRAMGKDEAEAQDRFWESIRQRTGVLNLPIGDRLCAIALVKRLFADVSQETVGGRIDVSNWPSTVYVAASPWVERVLENAPQLARDYARAVSEVVSIPVFSERPALVGEARGVDAGRFAALDGNLYHVSWVLRDPDGIFMGANDHSGTTIRTDLANRLREIARLKAAERRTIGYPSIFYALLLADGDSLGELLRMHGADRVSQGLLKFTESAPEIIRDHQGHVVYAGGDDVLALLPVTSALQCARALSDTYRNSFDPGMQPTLSAAVLFTHARSPLNTALVEARRLLDDVAKDGNGRDSLAVGILKRGGLNAQWVTSWKRLSFEYGVTVDAVDAVYEIASRLDPVYDGRLSTSLLYRLRNTFGLLCGWSKWSPGDWGEPVQGVELRSVIKADLISSLEHASSHSQEDNDYAIDHLVQLVLDVLTRSPGKSLTDPGAVTSDGTNPSRKLNIGIDGLLVAKFLATGGEEGEDQ